MAKKHKLTKKTDHIDGFSGKDLFQAPMFEVNGMEKATLSNKDVLNGRGGIDTISAFIAADVLKPQLKNIEKAVFTRHDTDALALDLAKSAKLSNIQLKNFDCDVDITHAGKLANFTVKNTLSPDFSIDGINATKVEKLSLNFINAGVDWDSGNHLDLQLKNTGTFKQIDIRLNKSFVDLFGSDGAETLTVHARGGVGGYNELVTYSDPTKDVTKSIVIDGVGDLYFAQADLDESYYSSAVLKTFDASAMTGSLYAAFGGVNLNSVKTGSDDDGLYIIGMDNTGGSVDLGAGNDRVKFGEAVVIGTNHNIYGGDGKDTAEFHGALANLSSFFHDFEQLAVWSAQGIYNLGETGVTRFEILSSVASVTLDHFASAIELYLNAGNFATKVNVINAANSTDDSLELHLLGGTFGNAFSGFTALGLSHLNIESKGSANTFYIGQLGTVADPVKITISGDQHLNLLATASNIHIGELTIDNATGVDLSALKGIQNIFLSTGATITGGAGNDVLVGGSGNDMISTGGGQDVVWASLGHDVFDFGGAGNDVLHYTSATQSNSNSEDWIQNFGAGDKIDLSALAANIGFVGNFSSAAAAQAQYSGSKINAFFNDTDHRLHVDLDDNHIVSSGDLKIYIPDLDAFSSTYLI